MKRNIETFHIMRWSVVFKSGCRYIWMGSLTCSLSSAVVMFQSPARTWAIVYSICYTVRIKMVRVGNQEEGHTLLKLELFRFWIRESKSEINGNLTKNPHFSLFLNLQQTRTHNNIIRSKNFTYWPVSARVGTDVSSFRECWRPCVDIPRWSRRDRAR